MAYYDHGRSILHIEDMPGYKVTVGKTKRQRIDDVALLNYFEMAKLRGADRVVIEQIWERPGDRGMFVMGMCVGLVRMACISARLPIEEIPPATWKRLLRVPGKAKDQTGEEIMRRADEMFPDHRDKFRGPKGGRLVDRAEAAMLGYYGETFLVGNINATDRT
jgi:hypothetical protein